jgi:hypothetical protein
LLKKNLVIIVRKRRYGEKNSINGSHHYEPLSHRTSLESRTNGDFPSNGHALSSEALDESDKPSNVLRVSRSLKSPVAKLKRRKLKISDAKVKR